MKGHGPADLSESPRFAGIPTFLRLPHTSHLEGVDAAIVGLPFDADSSARSGARFGPRAIREGSLTLRPQYNPAQRCTVFDELSVIDYGDAPVAAGFADRSQDRMAEHLGGLHAAGVAPLGLGGDHSVLIAELRAAAQQHGALALVQFAAHAGTLDETVGERYTHGTVIRRAIEEGLVDPARSTVLGVRGGVSGPTEFDDARALGLEVVAWDDLAQFGTQAIAAIVERASGKAFLGFDIDFVDPAFAPGMGTPEVGGPSSMQALAMLRGCRGLDLVGADVVGVIPEHDTSNLTATLAATLAWEILTLMACRP